MSDLVGDEQRHVAIIAVERREGGAAPGGGFGIETGLVTASVVDEAVIIPKHGAGIGHPDRRETRIGRTPAGRGPAENETLALRVTAMRYHPSSILATLRVPKLST